MDSIIKENMIFKILPLNLSELSLLAYDINNLEESLGYKYNYYPLNQEMKIFFKTQIKDILKNSKNFHFYTTWLIISKPLNEIIGFFALKNYNEKKKNIYSTINVNANYQNLDNSFICLILEYLTSTLSYNKLSVETNCPNINIYENFGFSVKDTNLFSTTFEKQKKA